MNRINPRDFLGDDDDPRAAAAWARVPESQTKIIDGVEYLSELGTIALCTAVEELYPEKAELARQFRYFISRESQKHRGL